MIVAKGCAVHENTQSTPFASVSIARAPIEFAIIINSMAVINFQSDGTLCRVDLQECQMQWEKRWHTHTNTHHFMKPFFVCFCTIFIFYQMKPQRHFGPIMSATFRIAIHCNDGLARLICTPFYSVFVFLCNANYFNVCFLSLSLSRFTFAFAFVFDSIAIILEWVHAFVQHVQLKFHSPNAQYMNVWT